MHLTLPQALWVQNRPLYIKSWGNDEADPLKFHRIIHRALDFIEERSN